VLELERFAALRARVETGEAIEEVLSGEKLTRHQWAAAQKRWLAAIAAELRNGRRDLAERYAGAFFSSTVSQGEADAPGHPEPEPQSAIVACVVAEPVRIVDQPIADVDMTGEIDLSIFRQAAVPFIEEVSRASPVPAAQSAHTEPDVGADIGMTCDVDPSLFRQAATPFLSNQPLARETADIDFSALVAGSKLPFQDPREGLMSLERYAEVSARVATSNDIMSTLERVDIRPADWAVTVRAYNGEFLRDPQLEARFEALTKAAMGANSSAAATVAFPADAEQPQGKSLTIERYAEISAMVRRADASSVLRQQGIGPEDWLATVRFFAPKLEESPAFKAYFERLVAAAAAGLR